MDNKVICLLKDRPFYMPRILLNNYKKLEITDEELIIIMVVMNYGDKVLYDPELFAKEINVNKHQVMKIINSLFDKSIFTLIMEKSSNKRAVEYISLDALYNKLFNIVLDKDEDGEIDNSIFGIFEGELGRMLSPMEYEKVKEWITSGNSNELIICALNEAVLKGVSNFNYIDSILNNWRKKGYKCKNDIMKEKEEYRNKKKNTDIFDTDWLND